MIQKNYLSKNPMMTAAAVADIKKLLHTTPHKAALLNVYETGFPIPAIKTMIDMLKCGCPDLNVAGISVYGIVDLPPDGQGIRLNLTIMECSDIEVIDLHAKPGEEEAAADKLRTRIEELGNVKAVQLFACNMGLNITRFLQVASRGHEDIPFFGTQTSQILPNAMSFQSADKAIEFQFGDKEREKSQVAIGNEMLSDGIVCVLFYGDELNAMMHRALGWQPIGRELDVTLGKNGIIGEACVTHIDGKRAVDIFDEYLGVKPNEFLVNNICEFPFIINRNDSDICIIPFDFDSEGNVYFTSSIFEGEKLRFSFATKESVIDSTDESLHIVDEFEPQALFLVMCGNRVNFLQEDAMNEWDKFKVKNPNLSLLHGASEISYQYGRGGVLNSTHVAIGFKESESNLVQLGPQFSIPWKKKPKEKVRIVPLPERMSVFLNKMTSELVAKAEEAEAANIAKSSFLSNMSHEIRTPINAILGMDEMILRESNEREIIRYAEDIRSASNTLLGLVNDILDFSKIEAGKMDVIPVEYEFTSVINDLYNVIKKRAEDKNLKLILEVDPNIPSVLYGDEIRVKQVMTNILTNAIKYTDEGSVTLSIKKERDGEVLKRHAKHDKECCFDNPVGFRVKVTDTGIGIKEEDKKKLGSAFQRVDEKRNRSVEGTGLGLNITARLLELMGSRLELESTYGEGSTFSFYLEQGVVKSDPIGDISNRWERADITHHEYREKFTAPDANILVVDDTKMNLDVICNLLKNTRINIDTALSGEECLELVTQNKYDIIFLDHRMPNMDGVECFNRMQELEDHKCPDAPVISLTANAVSGAREEYLEIGFVDYLTKPIEPDKLENMLMTYLPSDKVVKQDVDARGDLRGLPDWIYNVDGMDVESAVTYCGGEDSFLSILKSFYDTIDDKADEIKAYYDDKDWSNYNIRVHAMKSSARIIGLAELSELAKRLEDASVIDEGTGTPIDAAVIGDNTDRLINKLKVIKEQLDPISDDKELPDIPENMLDDAYASLSEFVALMDYQLSKMIIESVADYRLPPKDKDNFDKMNACLTKLDWDGISEILKDR